MMEGLLSGKGTSWATTTVNASVTVPQMTALMTGLPETYIPQNYKEAMARPDLWMPAMETSVFKSS